MIALLAMDFLLLELGVPVEVVGAVLDLSEEGKTRGMSIHREGSVGGVEGLGISNPALLWV